MSSYSKQERTLAAGYAFIAGFVDSVGFLFLGGVFLSFMSGNTTRAATSLVAADWDLAILASSCLILFLIGVMEGALVRRLARRWLPLHWVRDVVIANMDLMFVMSSVLILADQHRIAIMFASLGIGAMNSIFERDGEVDIALTYMTGTLVKMGQRFIDTFFGGAHTKWLQHFVMWSSLSAGAITGALSYNSLGIHAILVATALCLLLTLLVELTRLHGRRRGGTRVREVAEPA
ncbi:MAG TPA: YoaK family protein [Corynebacterium sp.]|nr:YoaK family protein [Corynebacterium sp.]